MCGKYEARPDAGVGAAGSRLRSGIDLRMFCFVSSLKHEMFGSAMGLGSEISRGAPWRLENLRARGIKRKMATLIHNARQVAACKGAFFLLLFPPFFAALRLAQFPHQLGKQTVRCLASVG